MKEMYPTSKHALYFEATAVFQHKVSFSWSLLFHSGVVNLAPMCVQHELAFDCTQHLSCEVLHIHLRINESAVVTRVKS